MNGLITDHEYIELLKFEKKKMYKTLMIVFICLTIFLVFEGIIVTLSTDTTFLDAGIWFFIPVGITIVLCIVFSRIIHRIDTVPFKSFVYDRYVEYQPKGRKIPLYRIVQHGKSSETIQMLLDIDGNHFELYDIKRKKLKLYKEGRMDEVNIKFYYKDKNGLISIKAKIDFYILNKKVRLFCSTEIGEKFQAFLKTEGYKTESQIGRMKKL